MHTFLQNKIHIRKHIVEYKHFSVVNTRHRGTLLRTDTAKQERHPAKGQITPCYFVLIKPYNTQIMNILYYNSSVYPCVSGNTQRTAKQTLK